MSADEERSFQASESLGWQEHFMQLLLNHLQEGKRVSPVDLAQVLRWTMDVTIPQEVRQVIIDLLDPNVKTGRSRSHKLFDTADDDFRALTIQEIYKELRDKKIKSIDAIKQIEERFNLGYETVRKIVNSKKKS